MHIPAAVEVSFHFGAKRFEKLAPASLSEVGPAAVQAKLYLVLQAVNHGIYHILEELERYRRIPECAADELKVFDLDELAAFLYSAVLLGGDTL